MITKMFYVEMKWFKTGNDFMFFFFIGMTKLHIWVQKGLKIFVKNILITPK